MPWLAAAIIASTLFITVSSGTFVAIESHNHLTYVFAWSGGTRTLLAASALTAILTTVYALAIAAARRAHPAGTPEAARGTWLAPLSALAAVVLGILPAAPGVGDRASVISYFLYDLRWWWLAVLVTMSLWRLDAVLGAPVVRRLRGIATWPDAGRLLLLDGLLVAGLIGWVTATSPLVRFTSFLFGDEPRYVRYCETWYQGRGCDVGGNASFTQTTLDGSPALLGNVSLMARTALTEVSNMAADVGQFAASPLTFHWLRSSGGRNGFVTGKNGAGMYELHQPGWSLLLLPGYLLDRYLLGTSEGHQDEFPSELVMTTTTTLVLYATCGIALFRLLRRVVDHELLAWLAAGFAMMTFPTAAFAFQLYPEIAAMLVVIASVQYIAARRGESTAPSGWRAAGAGGLMASLAWLHPRFMLLSVVLASFGTWATAPRRRVPLMLGWTAVLFTLGAYNYHITGSWMPNALYAASDDVRQLVLANIPDNLVGYAFHGALGITPNALWLLALVPGLAVLAGRDRVSAVLVACVALGLAVPAAGHALNPAGGTPGRFVVAVVPLMIWPVALLVRRFWHVLAVRVVVILLGVLSLDAALAYDLTFGKDTGPLIDHTASGWRPDLSFPRYRDYFEHPTNPESLLVLGIVGAIVAATAVTWRSDRRLASLTTRPRTNRFQLRSPAVVTTWAIVGLVLVNSAVARGLDRWTYRRYMVGDWEARNRAAEALVGLDRCRVCFSTETARLNWRLLDNPMRDPQLRISTAGNLAILRLDLGANGKVFGFGRVGLDAGDGAPVRTIGVVGTQDWSHTYASPGTYRMTMTVDGPAGRQTLERDVTIVADRTP